MERQEGWAELWWVGEAAGHERERDSEGGRRCQGQSGIIDRGTVLPTSLLNVLTHSPHRHSCYTTPGLACMEGECRRLLNITTSTRYCITYGYRSFADRSMHPASILW